MTMNDYEAGLEPELERRPRLRQALQAFGDRGLTDLELQAALPTTEWRTSRGRPFGDVGIEVRTLRRRLAELGLIQPSGRRPSGAAIYKKTPPGRAEAAARAFAGALGRAKKRKTRGVAAAKLAEMRKLEPGEWTQFDKTRKTILRLSPALRAILPMSFWEVVPSDELDWLRQEIEDLVGWGQQALDAFKTRKEDDALRGKIEKLQETAGRNEHEIANAKRIAKKLAERLP
jgi:hypothetical protein